MIIIYSKMRMIIININDAPLARMTVDNLY